jgi:Cu(I)/Ag(I) efflux system periplasmic protein CusF
MMKALRIVFAIAGFASAAAGAQQASQRADHDAPHPVAAATAAVPLSEGEVRKVDLAQGKVTLRHGALENLDMPAMTMVFSAADKQLLRGLKAGDKVRFHAESRDGALVLTVLEPVR